MISYVIPLYADSTTIGVVGMDIDFGIIKDSVRSIHLYDSGYAFLTDENARLVYHNELETGTSMAVLKTALSLSATN